MNRTTLATAGACVLAALTGYLLARHDPADADGVAGTSSAPRHSPVAASHTPGHVTIARTAAQLKALKDDLLARFASSPSAECDRVLREQAAALLATLSPEELEAFAMELAPAPTGRFHRISDGKPTLMHEVFRQWSLKDPAAACLALPDSAWGAGAKVFDDWLRRDPAAAEAWFKTGDFPPGSEKGVLALQQGFLNRQAATNFAAARDALGKLDAEAQKKTLLEWSCQLAFDPEQREELFALLASRDDPDFSTQCYQALIREMAIKSPHNAADFVEASHLSEEQKDVLHDQVLGTWATQDPHEAFARWAELKEDKAPEPLLKAMNHWSLNSPGAEEALEWVKALHKGPAREQFKSHLIGSMSSGERYRQAAELSATLDDPVERLRHMKDVKRQWEEKFPKSANEWLGTLSQEDREALDGSLK